MEKLKLTETKEAILKGFNFYLSEMTRLHSQGVYDEICDDIEDFAAIESIITRYIHGEEPDRKGLMIYFGDEERVDLVLSYFNIAKHLLENGATLNI